MKSLLLKLLLCAALTGGARAASADIPAAEPETVPNFRLLDHTGRSHELYRYRDRKLIVLMVGGNGCPIVRHGAIGLKQLREEFGPRGVVFALLNVNAHDSQPEIVAEAKEFGYDFPILLDPAQATARALKLQRTAEVLVIDPATWRLVYRGALDDRLEYGQQKPQPGRRFAAEAIAAFLAGEPVKVARTEVKGCAVTLEVTGPVDYAKQIAPLLSEHCDSCHSAGNIAPFAFSSYEKVRGHSRTIAEVLREDRMPPWHADPHHGTFANDRSLTAAERATLLEWIAQGAPRGTGDDPLPGLQPQSAEPWPLGKPDRVVKMPEEAKIPATGLIPYQFYVVAAPVEEDTWLRGVSIRAGNPKVVHHCLVFIRYPERLRHLEPPQEQGTAGFFAGFVPGTEPTFFPEGTGKLLPKGSLLIFQMHYTTTGKEETDRSELALYFAPEKPAAELVTGAATNGRFELAPNTRLDGVKSQFRFAQDVWLHELSPHLHLRGDTFTYTAVFPDGRSEVLLHVPHYDFNWQTLYRLKEPRRLPAGTRLVCSGSFDNTATNPANPNPNATVRFGEQTDDEMFIGYFNWSPADGQAAVRPAPKQRKKKR